MKTRNKAFLLISSAAVLTATSVFGTIAYLTSAKTAVNTFTVGKVEIDLEETDVDEDGNLLENEYRLVPGKEYVKDPTITVKADSESAYVRMILTVHNYSTVQGLIADSSNELTDFCDFLGGMDDTKWILEGAEENTEKNTISYEYRYYQEAEGAATDTKLEPLFSTLIVPSTLDGDELQALYDGGFKMVVEGHAIQADGFESSNAAWTAFDDQTAS